MDWTHHKNLTPWKYFYNTIFKKISWPTLHYQRSIYSISMDIDDCWATHVDRIKYNTVWSGTPVQKTDSGWQYIVVQVLSPTISAWWQPALYNMNNPSTSLVITLLVYKWPPATILKWYLFVQCFRPCGYKLKSRAATVPALLQSLSWFFFMALTWNLTVSHPGTIISGCCDFYNWGKPERAPH